MRKSDHFDGNRYFNPGIPPRRFKDLIKWLMTRRPTPWPKARKVPPPAKPSKSVHDQLIITFINHATMLIQWDGINFLTDPVWSERVSPFKWFGPKRVHPPGVLFEDLPPIHYILLSHNHYDHLDITTLRKLIKRDQPKILTGLGVGEWLHKKQKIENVIELDWWQSVNFPQKLKIIFTPTQHFSSRTLFDRDKTLWGGFAVNWDDELLYFSGDTAYCNVFKEIRKKFGSPRLALLPIGAYEPRWFTSSVHMSAEESLQAHLDLESKISLAYHFGTFRLTDEGIDDPPKSLMKEMERRGIPFETFWILEPGQSRKVP